ncbi:MAG: energy-coupling factor transporter ATPase [Clostridiales bacterium]|nr:energy-coupling factor transporter ATPase [Clostridiales bacterium]
MPVEIENVSYVYAKGTPYEAKALNRICLKIEDGTFTGVMGHTGCGKSTLIQLIAGLLEPSEGRIFLDGKDINLRGYDRKELRKKVGVIFQYPEYQLFETTVERDVMFGAKRLGLSRAETEERVRWALEKVGFDYERMRRLSPLGLSGGERKRIAMAGVLAVKPEILIMDEPIAGLDPLGREALLKLTDELNAEGTTIIMVSHDADVLAEHAGRVIVMENGEIAMDGAAKEILSSVKKLEEKRLGISQAAETAKLLRERGIDIGQDITRYDELVFRLVSYLKGGAQK